MSIDKTTITLLLHSPPVPITLPLDALPRWLLSHGWTASTTPDHYEKDGNWFWIAPDGRNLEDKLMAVAIVESMTPTALAADLLALDAPASPHGPPVQWEHLSPSYRAAAVADVTELAEVARATTAHFRADGEEAETVLRQEGKAAALQALASLPARLGAPARRGGAVGGRSSPSAGPRA